MRTYTLRLLAVGAASLLAACENDTASTGPLSESQAAVQPSAARVFTQLERLANPLVSEVMVVKARHHLYNIGQPSNDVAMWTGDLTSFVTGVAGRDAAYASAIAGALLPDMLLVFPKRDGTPVFWLSWVFGGYGGRSLPDDVVDTGLGVIFGALLGNTNNVTPGLTSDNVSATDVPFRATFPYLGIAQ
ncbi:MAG: DUF4331 family protein [Gemmatimonadaceae bacterium]